MPNMILPGDGNTLGTVIVGGVHYQVSTPFFDAVARGEVSGFSALHKFGQNANVTLTTQPETVWTGSNIYPYLSSAEQLQVASADVDDVGTVRSTGTATGGTTTTLVDTGADFVTDSVAAGDALVNDSNELHGIVLSATATVITLNRAMSAANDAGDTYRVVGADDTGAGLIKLMGLDASYVEKSEFVVLNGTTNVQTTAAFLRVFRGFTIIAGSSGCNEGQITANDNADAVTLLEIDPDICQTQMAVWTVPSGKTLYMYQVYGWESQGRRARVQIFQRPLGEVFRQIGRTIAVNGDYSDASVEPTIVFPAKTDVELRAITDIAASFVGGGFTGVYG
jgi:hypothetical protein